MSETMESLIALNHLVTPKKVVEYLYCSIRELILIRKCSSTQLLMSLDSGFRAVAEKMIEYFAFIFIFELMKTLRYLSTKLCLLYSTLIKFRLRMAIAISILTKTQ